MLYASAAGAVLVLAAAVCRTAAALQQLIDCRSCCAVLVQMNYPWASTDQIAACILQNDPKPVAQEPGMADEDIEQMFETLAGLDQVTPSSYRD